MMKLDHTNRRRSRRAPTQFSSSACSSPSFSSSKTSNDQFVQVKFEDSESTESPPLSATTELSASSSHTTAPKSRSRDKQKSRNRASAVRHRVRKKEAESKLDLKSKKLSEDYQRLKEGVAELAELRLQLKQLLMAHNMCNFAPIDSYHLQCAAEIAGSCVANNNDQTLAAATAAGMLIPSETSSAVLHGNATQDLSRQSAADKPIVPSLLPELERPGTPHMPKIDTAVVPFEDDASLSSISDQFDPSPSSISTTKLEFDSPMTPPSEFDIFQLNYWNDHTLDDMMHFPQLLQT